MQQQRAQLYGDIHTPKLQDPIRIYIVQLRFIVALHLKTRASVGQLRINLLNRLTWGVFGATYIRCTARWIPDCVNQGRQDK